MKDPIKPTFVVNKEQQIELTIGDPPIIDIPTFVVNKETKIALIIPPTDALVEEQGYTYNQAGFTYNQAGVDYGGIYNQNQDVSPIYFEDSATLLSPSISGIIDIGTQFGGLGWESVGPGWFMFVTYKV